MIPIPEVRPPGRFTIRYTDFLIRNPWKVVFAATALTAIAVFFASRLEFRVDLRELLPAGQQSVKDLARIEKRMGGTGTLVLAIESPDFEANKRFLEALVPRIDRLGKSRIKQVEYNVKAEKAFFDRNKYLYANLKDLVEFRDHLKKEFGKAALKGAGVLIDLSDDDDKKKQKEREKEKGAKPKSATNLKLDEFRAKYREKAATFDRYRDGYYAGEKGRLVIAFLRLPEEATSIDHVDRLMASIRREADGLNPATFHPALKIDFAGPLVTGRAEVEALKDELTVISIVCVGLVVLSIFLFFRRWRALGALGISLIMGCAWTFGLTQIVIGYLNTSTAFLGSIVAGNGVNFGIILGARYFEERRAGFDMRAALADALRYTAVSTVTAALAASVAYGSLLVTDFRGFNQFGFIGGIGMLLCWLASFTVLPALFVLAEKIRPVKAVREHPFFAALFTLGFPALIRRLPRTLAFVGVAIVFAAGFIVVKNLSADPFEYNLSKLRSERGRVGPYQLSIRVDKIVEGTEDDDAAKAKEKEKDNGKKNGGNGDVRALPGIIMLADPGRPDQVAAIKAALLRARDAAAPGQAAIQGVATIDDVLPKGVAKKIPIIDDIRRRVLEDAWEHLSDEQRREVGDMIPQAGLKPIGVAELPEFLARFFTEKDGTRGLVLYVAMRDGMYQYSGHDLMKFAAAVREVKLESGEIVTASGQAVIFADMLKAIATDGPRAIVVSFVGVVLLVLIIFRRFWLSSLVLFALAMGVLSMMAIAHLGAIRLNFLNFIAIPITLGIGVDYAVNVFMRYRHDGRGSMARVIATTGGAVVLCSLTTIIGYGSLLLSDNRALVSFGVLANIGELTCIVAATLIMPAFVSAIEGIKKKRRVTTETPSEDEVGREKKGGTKKEAGAGARADASAGAVAGDDIRAPH
ncbi:MAG: MMPL family transporter [Deltaproteobacteria bacterium]|nr:MMPL family transporter [Deltaproteobacteria bacterium]